MSGMFSDLPFFSRVTGDDGKNGVSPTITITDIEGGHKLTIVDVNGTKTVDILNGVNGKNGDNGINGTNGVDGKDGRGIQALAINEKGELVVTYTDSTQTTIGTVVGNDGQDGTPGSNGIDGTNGTDGKSAYQIWLDNNHEGSEADFLAWLKGPEGPAYELTDEDKAAIVAAVLAEINAQA